MYEMTNKQLSRFWMNVERTDTCWIWKGSTFSNGYGRFSLRTKSVRSHRIAYFLLKGFIPEDKVICHTCDNPLCVNPSHLWLGSMKENVQDMLVKGRIIRFRSKHSDSISKYPGISFRKEKKSKPWRARIMRNYLTVWKGEFESEEEAHQSRLNALKEISTI